MTSWLGVSNILQRLGKSSGQLHSSPSESIIIIIVIIRIDLTILLKVILDNTKCNFTFQRYQIEVEFKDTN